MISNYIVRMFIDCDIKIKQKGIRMKNLQDLINISNQNAVVILSIALVLFTGFLMTRITKKFKLPDVTAYLFTGILLGPYVLNLIPDYVVSGMDFITDIASAYIAFGVGKYFKLDTLRQNGKKMVLITLMEAFAAAVLTFLVMYFIFGLSLYFSLLVGAIATATSSASTMMTIRQYKAKGEMVNTILEVIALDNVIALIAFSICSAVVSQMEGSGNHTVFSTFILPVILNILVIVIGGVCGYLLKWIISVKRTREHGLILINAVLFGVAGLCACLDVSPLLACMMMGMIYVNIRKDKKLFKDVNFFSGPIMLLFFFLSGMRLNVPMLLTAGAIGLAYFAVRIIGKYLGARLGCKICGSSVPVQKYLGLALIPQTGVSVGLAALGQRLLPEEAGVLLTTIILSSGILYEIAGPACAKAALHLAGAIPVPETDIKKTKKEKKQPGNS